MPALKLKPQEIKRPDIFKYHDYRAFLKDWLDYLKTSQPGFSIRILSARAGIATGYLTMIFNGSRRLSEKAVHKLLPHLDFLEAEADYLSAMVSLSDSKSQHERIQALGQMQKLHASREKSKELQVHRYLSKWYYVAIREMVNLPGFKLDPEWINERLIKKISQKEITEAIEFLKAAGFICEMVDGSVQQTQKQLDCFSGIYRLALAGFHKEMVELGAELIDRVPREERNILGHTFAISEKSFLEVKALLDEVQKKISELENNDTKASRVYHVEMLTFPLTKKSGGKDD